MKQSSKHDKESEALLNRIAAELRDQAVPPMPMECLDFDAPVDHYDQTKIQVRRYWALLAVAATIALIVWTTYVLHRTGRPQKILPDGQTQFASAADQDQPDEIEQFELADPADLAAISAGIDDIQGEVERLKRQAELLDARRRATELLSVMASLDR